MTIESLHQKLKKIINSFDSDRDKIIAGLKSEIIDFNQEQMRRGFDVNDLQIGNLANEGYADEKKSKGGRAPYGWVDLYDTGFFQEGIILKITSDEVELFSIDSKNDKLVKKYSTTIFGLNESNLEKIQNYALEDYIKLLKDELQL